MGKGATIDMPDIRASEVVVVAHSRAHKKKAGVAVRVNHTSQLQAREASILDSSQALVLVGTISRIMVLKAIRIQGKLVASAIGTKLRTMTARHMGMMRDSRR